MKSIMIVIVTPWSMPNKKKKARQMGENRKV